MNLDIDQYLGAMKYSIIDFEREFPDDDVCLDYIFNVRYRDYVCPLCAKKTFYRVKGRKSYACSCGHQVNPLSKTIFKNSTTSLRLWFFAMYLFSQSRHGVPAAELQRQLGVTYKTAWRIGHKIRDLMKQNMEKSEGVFELDETYVGGKQRRYISRNKKNPKKKIPVFGILKREGDVFAVVVPNTQRYTLGAYIWKIIARGSEVCTDEAGVYNNLDQRYVHHTVNHSNREYVRGSVTTNRLEGFWSFLKNAIRSTHRVVSKKYLQAYVDERVFFYNARNSDVPIFHLILQRLTR
ncbi:MAG: IS1595 family transposase [Candidatus Magasanikbacteria bacterium]|jgi:transposase|nr:IS1595 family transposase [Candidatus Magasanikbacteria bacterium]